MNNESLPEFVYDLVVAQELGDIESAHKIEQEILARYLRNFRIEFQTNPKIFQAVKGRNAKESRSEVTDVLNEFMIPRTELQFEQSIDILLEELDNMRLDPSTTYLVNDMTGRSILKMTPDMVFQPPDFINEFGKLQKSQPILHPKISAPLLRKRYENGRTQEIIAKVGRSAPSSIEHVVDSNSILDIATRILQEHGIEIRELSGEWQDVEVGREQRDGVHQSLNPQFHRSNLWGGILARKILKMNPQVCEFGKITKCENSKQIWNIVSFKIEV